MNHRDACYAGVDVGAAFIKAVIVRGEAVVSRVVQPVSGSFRTQTVQVLAKVREEAEITEEDLAAIGITGMGAEGCALQGQKYSDVAGNARGISVLEPTIRTVIDLGSQFTRVLTTRGGQVEDFVMSEKCATGSGRFLQIMARILQMPITEMGPLSLAAHHPIDFSTSCAVFAESEAISRLAEGTSPADILAGVHRAMASKVVMLVGRLKWHPPVALVGGGGNDVGLVKAIEDALETTIHVPPFPQTVAALGVAWLAAVDC